MRTCSAHRLFVPCILVLTLLLGCTGEAPATREESAAPEAQIANPASEHCVELGGKLVIEKGEAGEKGMCHLPDGSVVEEWELFRRDRAEA